MKSWNKILLFVTAIVYLFLSTGVTLLQTHCLCSDSTRISLYAASESCDTENSDHGCCEEEKNHQESPVNQKHPFCGCDEPIVTYLKLTNHLDKGSNFEYPIGKQLSLVQCSESKLLQIINSTSLPIVYPEYSPPENPLYGRFLISFLHQRKIALTA